MNDELVNHQLETHEKRLNNHGDRLDKLEQSDKANAVRINNLCTQIASLVTTMRWFMGLIIGSFVAFFFYAAQRGLIK